MDVVPIGGHRAPLPPSCSITRTQPALQQYVGLAGQVMLNKREEKY